MDNLQPQVVENLTIENKIADIGREPPNHFLNNKCLLKKSQELF
jgi:hypothetical protein